MHVSQTIRSVLITLGIEALYVITSGGSFNNSYNVGKMAIFGRVRLNGSDLIAPTVVDIC